MQHLRAMPSKELKPFFEQIKKQWGSDISSMAANFAFYLSSKGRVYIATKDIAMLDLGKLKLNSVGMYFAELKKGMLRLSIEGSQIVGPKAEKNILELSREQVERWLSGQDMPEFKGSSFVIVKHDNDFLGCGKLTEEKGLMNYVPKGRRVNEVI